MKHPLLLLYCSGFNKILQKTDDFSVTSIDNIKIIFCSKPILTAFVISLLMKVEFNADEWISYILLHKHNFCDIVKNINS